MFQFQRNAPKERASSIHAGGLTRLRIVALSSGIALLVGIIGFALQREMRRGEAPQLANSKVRTVEPVALTAEEEDYAQALWAVHSAAKVWAIDLSFAGILYKIESHDLDKLGTKVKALSDNFASAESRARAIVVPASMRTVHDKYLSAIHLYENAAQEMLKTTQDRDDKHLLDGQGMSQHAAEDMLRVGDVLWPGEYKPN